MPYSAQSADFHCQTSLIPQGKKLLGHEFKFSESAAKAAMAAGGTTRGVSGFPHEFTGAATDGRPTQDGGGGGGSGRIKFLGADAQCNEKDPKLLEYPILLDGKKYNRDDKRSGEGLTHSCACCVSPGRQDTLWCYDARSRRQVHP
ncbi:uncharacterized protein JN550_011584 [Neoarthrinium moseri]|uniref:uncharacterized protein n=1 Tax=Neoarthrinium moseri TaxID=1658444 RepID=UPI001FDCD1DE|nr:uncharacterized protein JN550_011584 [Neoarthrinium moseri]KAI1860318.1 hypothetical protein JN550_011584 [Neoarthrinium moseri]